MAESLIDLKVVSQNGSDPDLANVGRIPLERHERTPRRHLDTQQG